jgi:ferritin
MLNPKIEKAFNEQINAETYSAYLYMSMAAWFQGQQLNGFAHWFKVQAQEELTHALRFYAYVFDRGGKVALTAIAAPPTAWDSPLACLEAVLAHEIKVTGLINKLVTLARKETDYASENFLQWFVKEQVEEEASVEDAIGKLKMINQTEGGLFMLDKDMAARIFTMPIDITI